MMKDDVKEVGPQPGKGDEVIVHCIKPDDEAGLYNLHTHGLEAHGHKEFEAMVPGFTASAVTRLLRNHAESVLKDGERFKPDDAGEIDGFWVKYVEVPGDFPGDPTRLRIMDSVTPCGRCNE